MPLVRVSNGGTDLHYMALRGTQGPYTISCVEGYMYCVTSSPHVVVKIDGVKQTPINKTETSSYYFCQFFYFHDLNNAILSMDKGLGMLAYT